MKTRRQNAADLVFALRSQIPGFYISTSGNNMKILRATLLNPTLAIYPHSSRQIRKFSKHVRHRPFSPDPIVLVFSIYLRSWRQTEGSIAVLMP
jgi:hypothetical protein